MGTARKDVIDALNERALECAIALIDIGLGKDKGGADIHVRMGALKAILNKVVPDLRAQELKLEGTISLTSEIDISASR